MKVLNYFYNIYLYYYTYIYKAIDLYKKYACNEIKDIEEINFYL